MTITAQEFLQGSRAMREERRRQGMASGPRYSPRGSVPAWHDQYFEREIEPAGAVNCAQALRVGSTLSALNVVLRASASNENTLVCAAGATITVTYMIATEEKGTYEDYGPSLCITAPAAGIEAEAGEALWRFPIGDQPKGWLMVNLEFSGAITGGKVDCLLDYIPR